MHRPIILTIINDKTPKLGYMETLPTLCIAQLDNCLLHVSRRGIPGVLDLQKSLGWEERHAGSCEQARVLLE
jgi:hypothetical protein